jgi:hypothetical protein
MEKGMDVNTNIGLGFKLTKFHEFWWIYILQGLNRKTWINMERIPSWHDYMCKPDRHQHWKTLEDARRHPNENWAEASTGRAAGPTHRPASLVPPGSDIPFPWRLTTDISFASWPLFKVSLIRGPRFIPPGYKTRPRPPLENQSIHNQSEVSLERITLELHQF